MTVCRLRTRYVIKLLLPNEMLLGSQELALVIEHFTGGGGGTLEVYKMCEHYYTFISIDNA